MASIKVDSTSMRDKATTFRTVATNINRFFEDMTTEIHNMKSVWTGEAAEAAVVAFEKYKTAFEEKNNTINGYATFLDSAAEAYDNAEQAIQNATE